MSQRSRSVSPQLRALGPDVRILNAFIDVLILGVVHNLDDAWDHPLVKTAILAESGQAQGWNPDHASRVLAARGWKDADGIYNAAGIPEKRRRVIDLALWRSGDPDKKRKGYFTFAEIATLTGHPKRTVEDWVRDAIPRLRLLDLAEAA